MFSHDICTSALSNTGGVGLLFHFFFSILLSVVNKQEVMYLLFPAGNFPLPRTGCTYSTCDFCCNNSRIFRFFLTFHTKIISVFTVSTFNMDYNKIHSTICSFSIGLKMFFSKTVHFSTHDINNILAILVVF